MNALEQRMLARNPNLTIVFNFVSYADLAMVIEQEPQSGESLGIADNINYCAVGKPLKTSPDPLARMRCGHYVRRHRLLCSSRVTPAGQPTVMVASVHEITNNLAKI